MPPHSDLEWMEAWGPLAAPSRLIHGGWNGAVETTTQLLDAVLPESTLEKLLNDTCEPLALKSGKVCCVGSGWGALEEARRGSRISTHLDFGVPGEDQKEWLRLLHHSRMNDRIPPRSWMVQGEWLELLSKATPSWKTQYHLALGYYHSRDWELSCAAIRRAVEFDRNAWCLHAEANILRAAGFSPDEWLPLLCEAVRLNQDYYLVKEAVTLLNVHNRFATGIELHDSLPERLKAIPMLRFQQAIALAHSGRLNEASSIIAEVGGVEIPDTREACNPFSIAELYVYIQSERTKRNGEAVDAKISVPRKFDDRMNYFNVDNRSVR